MKLLSLKEKQHASDIVSDIKTNNSSALTLGSSSYSASFDHSSPATKLTSKQSLVVSVLVEIVSCSNLSKHKESKERIDPYVKVKLSKPLKKGGTQLNLHKTKSIKNTTNPRFTRMSHSSFVIDGLSVADLYKADGLQFKVKHAKHDLGFLHLTPPQLLQANGQDTVLEWIHPLTMLPGRAGTITMRANPLQSYHDREGFKAKGMGYFVDYVEAKEQPPPHRELAADTQESDSYMGDEELKVLLSPRSKAKKRKSLMKSLFGSSGSSRDKKKSIDRETKGTPTEEERTIGLSPSNDEEDARIHMERQSAKDSTSASNEVKDDKADASPSNDEQNARVHTEQSTNGFGRSKVQGTEEEVKAEQRIPQNSNPKLATDHYDHTSETASLDPYGERTHGRPSEVYLDFGNPQQEKEAPCCFSLFGWTPKKVVSNLMEYSDPQIIA